MTRRIIWIVLVLVVLAAAGFGWRALTLSTTPRGLIEVTLNFYRRAPHIDPFAMNATAGRLFAVSNSEAREALNACPVKAWTHIGIAPKPYADSYVYHLWECRRGDVVLYANELWEPHGGIDGVSFAACRKPACPPVNAIFGAKDGKTVAAPNPLTDKKTP